MSQQNETQAKGSCICTHPISLELCQRWVVLLLPLTVPIPTQTMSCSWKPGLTWNQKSGHTHSSTISSLLCDLLQATSLSELLLHHSHGDQDSCPFVRVAVRFI